MTDEAPPPDPPPDPETGRSSGPWASLRGLIADPVDRLYIAALVVLGAWSYYVRLGVHGLNSWDEGIYAVAARNMAVHGEWLVPMVNWQVELTPFLDKPPGLMWLQGASVLLMGPTTFAVRFPSATFAILSGLAVYLVGREVLDRTTGFVAGAVFMSIPFVLVGTNAGRTGGLETGVLFFGTLAVLLVWMTVRRDDARWLVPAGIAFGLAVLAKGFQAGIFVVVAIPLLVVAARRGLLRTRSAARGAALAGLLPLPWFAYALSRYRGLFVEKILLEQVLHRATGTFDVTPPGAVLSFMRFPYFRSLPSYMDPYLYLLVPAAAVAVWAAWRRRGAGDGSDGPLSRSEVGMLLWWLLGVLAFFASTGNHGWYVMPMYVPAALLVGYLVVQAARGKRAARVGFLAGIGGVFLLSSRLPAIAPFSIPKARWDLAGTVVEGPGLAVAFLLAVATVLSARRLAGDGDRSDLLDRLPRAGPRTRRRVAAVGAAMLFFGTVAAPVSLHVLPHDVDQRRMGQVAGATVPSNATVYVEEGAVGSLQRPLLVFSFYADREMAWASLHQIDDDRPPDGSGSIDYAVVRNASRDDLQRDHEVLIAIDNGRLADLDLLRFT